VTIEAQIDALESLAVIDAELKDLSEELGRERQALNTKQQHLAELDARLARDRKSVEDMERMRSELMAEVRQMSVQVEKSREKLSRCRTEREANAAQREVEELRKLYRDRELEIDKLVTLVENARGEIEKVSAEREVLGGELGANQSDVATRLADLEERAATRDSARKEAVSRVSPVLYRRYELIRKRRGTALAHTVEGTCSACHMRLPPMLFQQLMRKDDFSQCPSCNRILYFRPERATADSQSSGP
jgi:predicted  nucleic acid-binding Zn-ribbon protein